ncbi:hypothetical protein HMPREF0185_01945 [Brevundimonas diminuta 470-4]|nr:hypothetical protein HMPREF0185_01945 [Brevundimonas diminuta 470-4]
MGEPGTRAVVATIWFEPPQFNVSGVNVPEQVPAPAWTFTF